MVILILANPVACAAALTSLEFVSKGTNFQKIERISLIHQEYLEKIRKN